MSDRAPVVSCHNLKKIYLERVVLDDVTFALHEGERVALLGANGAGKSTLLGILSGTVTPEGGEVRFRRGLTVAVLDQGGALHDEWTVAEEVDHAFDDLRAIEDEINTIHDALAHDPHHPETDRRLERQHELQDKLDHADIHTLEARKAEAMSALGLPEGSRVVGQLSGGERRRVALCRTLLQAADLLILDEPTNHLDAETLDWLEDYLARFRGTVLFVTHDRYFLDNVATKMIEVSRGRASVYQGNYSAYLEAKQIEDELAGRREETRQNLLKRELEWLRRQPRARTTKSQARIDRAHDLMASKPQPADGRMQMLIPTGPRLGNTLVECEGVTHSLGGRTLVRDFTFTLGKGDRVGIVGRNGLGKTTLLRLLLKQDQPEAGTIRHGLNVKFVYADQQRANLDLDKTVLQEVAGEVDHVEIGGVRYSFRTWLARFLFDDNTAAMPIRLLSGGERNRVQLAKMLREGGNIVVLDEPTNDLDLPTLRILEEALARFEGCAFVVSHDRYFLNRVTNRILGFRGDGRISIVEGNYDHYKLYLEREAAREAETALAPPAAARKPGAAPTAAAPPAKKQRKLSFNEQREFDTMEARLAEAEAHAAKLATALEDPVSFSRGKDAIADLMKQHAEARAAVEKLYERWAELEGRN